MPTQPRKTAAKKTAARRPANRADKPTPVAVNFDTWTRKDQVDPFPIVVGGKRYESVDPMDLDYRQLSLVLEDDPDEAFRILFPDDFEAILENHLPTGAMIEFNQGVVTHFGLEDFIAAQS